jgi:hypothetical protein
MNTWQCPDCLGWWPARSSFLGLKDDLVIARDVYCAAVATARRQARDYTARVYYRSDAERAAAYDSYLEAYCNGLQHLGLRGGLGACTLSSATPGCNCYGPLLTTARTP